MQRTTTDSRATIVRLSDGRYELAGELDFDSVPLLLEQAERLFATDPAKSTVVDLAAVNRGNSAALGLLLEWVRMFQQQNREIHFRHVPDELLAIAHVSDLDDLLPVAS